MAEMVNLGLNFLTFCLWVAVALVAFARYLEHKGLEYSVVRTPTGMYFKYKLGVYAGRIELIRDDTVTSPTLTQGVSGWECRFPGYFTLKEMCSFISSASGNINKKGSHSKDLLIFDEIVNRKNDALVSINGTIYAYDNSDHRPFKFR